MRTKGYTLQIKDELQTIVVTVKGAVNLEMIKAWTVDGRTEASKRGYGMLVNLKDAIIPSEYGEAYYLPRNTTVYNETLRKVTVAIVLPDDHDYAFWRFYETSCRNACLKVSTFKDEHAAYNALIRDHNARIRESQ